MVGGQPRRAAVMISAADVRAPMDVAVGDKGPSNRKAQAR